MITIPIGLTIYLTRKFNQGWRLFWIGAATFIFSQALHIPFNSLVSPVFNRFDLISLPIPIQNTITSVFLGLSAGTFEELSRYFMFRWWAKDARSWGTGLLAGAGHGGFEAIVLGMLVLYSYIQMLIARGVDISTLVTPDRVELAKAQIQAYWSAPWYMTLLGVVERIFTIPLHLACSVLVLQAFTRRQLWWVGLAILFHALADGVSVFISQIGFSALAIEGIIGVFSVFSILVILALRQPEPFVEVPPAHTLQQLLKHAPIEESLRNLDETRYQ
jgi:uncharacterized membrane protein YhfC